MNQLKKSKYIMIVAIFTIAAFQGYWLYKLYYEEYNNIQKQADVLLKQTVQSLQESSLKNDSNFLQYVDHSKSQNNFDIAYDTIKKNRIVNRKKDTSNKKQIVIDNKYSYDNKDSTMNTINRISDSLLRYFKNNKTRKINEKHLGDSITTKSIIINSQFSNNIDSILSVYWTSKTKDTAIGKRLPSKIKLDSIIKAKGYTSKFKLNKSDIVVKVDTSKINFSNLIIRVFTDSIAPKKVDSVFKQVLVNEKVNLPYKLITKRVSKDNTNIIDTSKKSLHTSATTIGLVKPMAYQAQFDNPFWFIIKRISLPITMSVLLLCFVTAAFIFLYKNMMAQKRLAAMKTDFISNVTHELKTPIATVNVAIEALRNFNAIKDKKKSKDYLDISAMEINRLGLLVDNVLKLSMFENDRIELQKEKVDIVVLTKEVINALGIQIDKRKANIDVNAEPENIFIHADKLHLTSILFNLIDNALKYSKENPQIEIILKQINNQLHIVVSDNGIGISKENQQKIFDKFYRVETNDRHNVKGYGLGLNYVDYIVKKHNGTIKIKSELNKGSAFEIALPL